jgi:hypothetical protein
LKGKEKSWGCLKETGRCYNPMNANQAKVIIWLFFLRLSKRCNDADRQSGMATCLYIIGKPDLNQR